MIFASVTQFHISFHNEKSLVGAFSVIVQLPTSRRFGSSSSFFCHHHQTQQSKSHAEAEVVRKTDKTQVVRHSREIPRKGSDAFHELGCEMCAHLASYLSIVRNWPLSTVWLCLQANLKVSICPSMISKTGIIENTKYDRLLRARTHDNFDFDH